jgi:hypothetical protein
LPQLHDYLNGNGGASGRSWQERVKIKYFRIRVAAEEGEISFNNPLPMNIRYKALGRYTGFSQGKIELELVCLYLSRKSIISF